MLILDDVGYVQQSPEEAEILLTFLAERFRASLRCSPADGGVSSVEPAARSVVNTRDAEETFAYMIMLSANKLLGSGRRSRLRARASGCFCAPTKNPHEMGSQKGNVKERRKVCRP